MRLEIHSLSQCVGYARGGIGGLVESEDSLVSADAVYAFCRVAQTYVESKAVYSSLAQLALHSKKPVEIGDVMDALKWVVREMRPAMTYSSWAELGMLLKFEKRDPRARALGVALDNLMRKGGNRELRLSFLADAMAYWLKAHNRWDLASGVLGKMIGGNIRNVEVGNKAGCQDAGREGGNRQASALLVNSLAVEIHKRNHRWWHHPKTGKLLKRNRGEMLMLIVSEIAEAMESERKGGIPDTHLTHRNMAEVELADALIRILDYAAGHGYDIGGAMIEKFDYNDARPDHKGRE